MCGVVVLGTCGTGNDFVDRAYAFMRPQEFAGW
jgi:hypothetical protein